MNSSKESTVIRRARDEDVDRILDLLAHYDVPRSYFEPFYLRDPSYRPEHSWVADQEGRLVAHLRVYDRRVRAGEARLRIAGVGNVITAPDQRGRGHAGRLLDVMLKEIPAEGFAYSLLRAYQSVLYERYGWAPIDQDLMRMTLPPTDAGSITPFTDADLPDVMRLYDETNAGRSGTTIRSPEYWRSQLEWLREDRDGFLLSRTEDGALAGYVRSRAEETDVEILELGLRAGDAETGRALLSAAAIRGGGRLRAYFPASLKTLFGPGEAKIKTEFGLMGRVMDLAALVAAMEPVWLQRVRQSDGRGGSLHLATSAGRAEVQVSDSGVRIDEREDNHAVDTLGEGDLAHLLFRGFDAVGEERLGAREDASLLRTLFPAQDFVVWRAGAF
jgi:N-acetylglutamate synthase-like GNAT family acetyltransferase